MKTEKANQRDVEILKKWIEENNNTVYTVLRHVSKSGMYWEISVVIPVKNADGDKMFVHTSYIISCVLGWKYSEKHGSNSVVCIGAGMDMGFHLVDSLSYALYGDRKKLHQGWI